MMAVRVRFQSVSVERASSWLVLSAFVACIVLASLPVLIVRIAPLADYPQHLARVYILANLGSSFDLQRYYVPDWGFQPNLAIELIALPVTWLMNVNSAGRFFLVLLLFSLSSGCLALHRCVHRRWSLWPLIVFFVLYNRIFLGGIVNYLFTLGISFWAFAAWIYFREHSSRVRIAVSVPLALILLLGHMVAFGVYALMVIGFESTRHLQSPRKWYLPAATDLIATGSQFAVALGVLVAFSKTVRTPAEFRYDFLEKLDAPFNLFYNYHLWFDGATFLVLIILLLAGLAAGRVELDKRLLASIGLLIFAFFAMPFVMASSHGADRRMTVAIALLVVAATDWRPEQIRLRTTLIAALAALYVVRMSIIGEVWLRSDRIYDQFTSAFDKLPKGARLGVVIAHKSTQTIPATPVNSIAQFAIIRRDAFVNTTFTIPGAQPLSFTKRYSALAKQLPIAVYELDALRRLSNPSLSNQINPFVAWRLNGYDYLLVIHESDFPVRPPPWLLSFAEGTDFRLFKVGLSGVRQDTPIFLDQDMRR